MYGLIYVICIAAFFSSGNAWGMIVNENLDLPIDEWGSIADIGDFNTWAGRGKYSSDAVTNMTRAYGMHTSTGNLTVLTDAGESANFSFNVTGSGSSNNQDLINHNILVTWRLSSNGTCGCYCGSNDGILIDDVNGNTHDISRYFSQNHSTRNSNTGMTVVPIAPAIWLFGSGILSVLGVALRTRK